MVTLEVSSVFSGKQTSANEANHLTSKVNFCLLFEQWKHVRGGDEEKVVDEGKDEEKRKTKEKGKSVCQCMFNRDLYSDGEQRGGDRGREEGECLAFESRRRKN